MEISIIMIIIVMEVCVYCGPHLRDQFIEAPEEGGPNKFARVVNIPVVLIA
jgi:hypothetical protein